MHNGIGLVRISALSGYQRVADRLGLDTGPLLKAAGLTPLLMSQPEQFVPAGPLIKLLEDSAQVSGCATFGLHMALERTLSDMGLISVLMALQPSFGALLETLGRYRNTMIPILLLRVERAEEVAIVHGDLALPPDLPHRQSNELLLGTLVGLARTILGADWAPESAWFSYPEPDQGDRPTFQRLFGSNLHFNAEFNGMVVPLRDLDLVPEGADPRLASHATALIEQALNPVAPSIVQRAQDAVAYLLASSGANLPNVAEMLQLHPRTLQRRLELEGVSFSSLVRQTRIMLARRFLANRNLTIAEIAESLGYSSTGAFSRWYRSEFGLSPQQARDRS